MQTRVDELCNLVAEKTTSAIQIIEFIEEHEIDINQRHTEDTHVVDFAAQSGTVENVRFLIEIMNAELSSSQKPTGINILQWAHDRGADPETRIYLSDLEMRLWEKFNDGTNELHIYAYHGRLPEVLAILENEPDRICDYAHDKYGPLYWANLANADGVELTEMQILLQARMKEYKQRHGDNKINMLHYYIGMIFAASANLHAYDEFDDFLTLCDELCVSNPEMKEKIDIIHKCYFKDMHVNLYSLYQTIDRAKFPADKKQHRAKLEKLRSHQHFIASTQQLLKILESKNNTIYDKKAKLTATRITLLSGIEQTCQHYLDLLAPMASAENKNWELFQEYLNIIFEYTELGKCHNDDISDTDLISAISIENRRNKIKRINDAQKSIEAYESAAKMANPQIAIRRKPIKGLIVLVQDKTTTVEQVHGYLANHPVSMTDTNRFHRTVIDQAVIFGTTEVVIDLVENNLEALVVPVNSKRQTVMQILRRADIDATTKDYFLAPERKLWELMGDGTTEIMVHAFAGRMEAVLQMIEENGDRLIETNRRGENVFYWAYQSHLRETFKTALIVESQYFSDKLVAVKKWDKLLKLYQASEKFMNECLKPFERAYGLRSSIDWFESINADDSDEYVEVKDYLYYKLASALLQIIETDEIICQKHCRDAEVLLLNINDYKKREDLQLIINVTLCNSLLRQAKQQEFEADELQWQMKQPKRQEKLLNTCAETLTLALSIIAPYPNSNEEIFELRQQMDKELALTRIKIANLEEFSFQFHAVSPDSKDEIDYDFIKDAEETLKKSEEALNLIRSYASVNVSLPSLFPFPSLNPASSSLRSVSIFRDNKDDKGDKKTDTQVKLPEVKPDQEDLLDAEDVKPDQEDMLDAEDAEDAETDLLLKRV